MIDTRPQTNPDRLVINVKQLSKRYGAVHAVDGLDFSVLRGSIFGLLGPNGAGKSTTFNILTGLQEADSGEVKILGQDIRQKTRQIKQRVGVLLQTTNLIPDLTAFDQINLFASLYGYHLDNLAVQALLDRVGLLDKANAFPSQLSGGQQQRLAIALALVNDPEILFFDEPTTGLDPQSRHALWDLIREICAQGRTVVLSTHYMEEAEMLCHEVGIIDRGKLLAIGMPKQLINQVAANTVITIAAVLPMDAVRACRAVVSVNHDGTLMRIESCDVTATNQDLLDLSIKHNVVLDDINIQRPNLESVFLTLTGRELRA